MYNVIYYDDDDFEETCRELLVEHLYDDIGSDEFNHVTLLSDTFYPSLFSEEKLNKLAQEFNFKSIILNANKLELKPKTTTLLEEISLLLLLLRFNTNLVDYELINYIIERNDGISSEMIYSLFGYFLKLKGITVNNHNGYSDGYYDDEGEWFEGGDDPVNGIATSIGENYWKYRKNFKEFYKLFPKLYEKWNRYFCGSDDESFKYFSSQFIGE